MKAAELFVKCLQNEGVTRIFGLPGEENAHLMMALHDSPIEFVLTRHEQGAAFMADVHGRLTGEPGVCLGTLGPGATNLVTGVADGNMDRAPMIVITGQAGLRRQHKESHQNMDVVGMFKPLTKWATPVIHPDNVPEVVRKAFKLATTEKPGACHIELAEDIAELEAETEPIPAHRVRRPTPDDKIIDRAMAVIRESKRPVILAGNGAIRKRASKQLRLFSEATGISVINTFMGKGAVSRHSENCLFTIGLQAKDVVACAIDAADLVITLGYDLVEYPPRLWNSHGAPDPAVAHIAVEAGAEDDDAIPSRDLEGPIHPLSHRKIIHIDFEPAEVDEHYRVDVEVVGDLAHTLWMLNERVTKDPITFSVKQHRTIRKQMLEEFAIHMKDETEGLIRPQKVLWDVREAMGPDDILLSGVGAHKMWIARHYQCDEPNTCLISNGFCSMGFALPGAIGAKLVHPDRNVMAICGDADFLMNVQEMETAKRIGANIVVMVWEDGGYGLIKWKQDNEFGRHSHLDFGNPDFVKLADAFGWNGWKVERSQDLKDVLRQAFASENPSLICIPIDYRENALLSKRLGNLVCPI